MGRISFGQKVNRFSNRSNMGENSVTVIKPHISWLPDLHEVMRYRDLCFFLVWREVKVLYAQTVLGLSWAILQPIIQVVLFTIIFGRVVKVPTDGIPYILFSTVAIVPWTYMSQAMVQSSQSLVQYQNMLGKVYFPRLLFPLTPVLARLIDFGIAMVITIAVIIHYHVLPTWKLFLLPIFVIYMMSVPLGIGMWLSAMSIRFRDIKHGMPFVIRMLLYTAPIVYSASSIPEKYRLIYSLNPIVGVIEGYRVCLLGTSTPWYYIWPGMISALIIFVSGSLYFRKTERIFVDVI